MHDETHNCACMQTQTSPYEASFIVHTVVVVDEFVVPGALYSYQEMVLSSWYNHQDILYIVITFPFGERDIQAIGVLR